MTQRTGSETHHRVFNKVAPHQGVKSQIGGTAPSAGTNEVVVTTTHNFTEKFTTVGASSTSPSWREYS